MKKFLASLMCLSVLAFPIDNVTVHAETKTKTEEKSDTKKKDKTYTKKKDKKESVNFYEEHQNDTLEEIIEVYREVTKEVGAKKKMISIRTFEDKNDKKGTEIMRLESKGKILYTDKKMVFEGNETIDKKKYKLKLQKDGKKTTMLLDGEESEDNKFQYNLFDPLDLMETFLDEFTVNDNGKYVIYYLADPHELEEFADLTIFDEDTGISTANFVFNYKTGAFEGLQIVAYQDDGSMVEYAYGNANE